MYKQISVGTVRIMKVLSNQMWWTVDKERKYWLQIYTLMQLILKVNIQIKPEAFFVGYAE